MKNYKTPCVTLVEFKEDVITASDNYIRDTFDDISNYDSTYEPAW